MSHRSITPIILLSFAAFCLMGSFAIAGTMDIVNGHVGFMIGGDHAYFEGTTDNPGEQHTHNRVALEFESGWPPQTGAQVTSIFFTLNYDENLWEFYEVVQNANWPGTMDVDTTGDGYIQIIFSGQGMTPPTSFWTTGTIAEIHLRPRCQPEFQGSPVWHALTYDPTGPNYATVSYTLNDILYNDIYYPDPMYDAFLGTQPYIQDYTVQNASGILGEVVDVPVLAETNFRLFSTFQVIDFDETRLEYVDVVPNPDIFQYTMTQSNWGLNASGNLEVYLTHDSPAWPLDWIPELDEEVVLYWVQFRVLGDGDDIDIPVNFVQAECEDTVWTAWRAEGQECEEFQTSINPPGTHNGFVQVPQFFGEYYSEFDGNYINKAGGIQMITFNMRMQNDFPAGNYIADPDVGAISAVFEVPDEYMTFVPPVSELNDSLDFHSETYANGATYLHVYQEYNSGVTGNFWPQRENAEDIVAMNFYFNEANYTLDYANRYISLPFVPTGHDWETYMEDTTGYAVSSMANGKLTTIVEPVEVHMGEFHSDFASSGNRYINQDIWMRANFDIGAFSVNINVSSSFSITGATTYLGAQAETIDYNTRRIYFTGSAFHDATGNDFIKIATITYRAYCSGTGKIGADGTGEDNEVEYGGGPGSSYTATASTSFDNEFIEDNSAGDHFVCKTPSNVRGTCSTIPIDDIIEKEQNDNLMPDQFSLNQNHPNPFNPTTTISYDVPSAARVKIDIVNILGQTIVTLVDEIKSPGSYQAVWNGTDARGIKVSSGIYLYTMQAGDYVKTKKMMLMK